MRYVIIGNGVAGTTAADEIRKLDESGEVVILTEEAYPFYSRIRIIECLSGEAAPEGLIIRKDEWYKDHKISLRLSSAVDAIDSAKHEVSLKSGEKIGYDRLLLATGGVSFVPPVPGADRKGVFTLRTMEDALAIRNYAESNRRVLILGGGVLGLEVGNALRKAGNSITVVEFFPRLLPRQMDPEGAEILKSHMEKMGFTFYLGAKSKEIAGEEKAAGLVLEDGRRVECDMIVISAGVRPRADLAKKLGLKIEKGVSVNDRMETGIENIFAAGDLIEHKGVYYGIWQAAEQQGRVAGIAMAGGDASYEGTTMSNMLKVVGVELVAVGDIDADGTRESFTQKHPDTCVYKKLVIDDNRIVGAILCGDITNWRRVSTAIGKKRDIRPIREELKKWNLDSL